MKAIATQYLPIEEKPVDRIATGMDILGPAAKLRPAINPADRLFNRELSQLEFYRRVLGEALDDRQPLLERLKFLAILTSNLDEFFMIRVSGLKETAEHDFSELSADGRSAHDQLRLIRAGVLPLVEAQVECLRADLLPQLATQGIEIANYSALTNDERDTLDHYFDRQVFPILTPQAMDPAHPFPYISGLSLNLGLMVGPEPVPSGQASTAVRADRFVRLKVPPIIPRLVPVGRAGTKFVLLEDLVANNLGSLFPHMRAGTCQAFCVTRDADVDVREQEAEDLLRAVQQTLRKRRFGMPVRLEVASSMPAEMVSYLAEELGLEADDVYATDGPQRLSDLMALYKLDRPDLKDPVLHPTIPAELTRSAAMFDVIRAHDVLVHHPYTSYRTVVNFINTAADDPEVLAIKICLYRTGADSPIPPALIRASERGKQVTVLIELKARFDEEANIEWAQKLERAGVHVVYGVVGLKTHCKLTLVVRREGDDLRRYVHIATGNYNPTTSCTYTDLGLFTVDDAIGADASELFNYLTGYSGQNEYRSLIVAPVNLRERMIAMIRRETDHARSGKPARIIAKINRLSDLEIISALYEASTAGVELDLIVRGICLLRPGIRGLSENIRVRSIVGRFLEHSRVFFFANGGDEELYIGSADWMERNLDRRVEVVAPINDPRHKTFLKDTLLAAYLHDNAKAWQLNFDGSYERVGAGENEPPINSQEFFVLQPDPKHKRFEVAHLT